MSPHSPGLGVESDAQRITRRLKAIHQELTLPVEQEIEKFLTSAENAWKINSLVDDVHEALMEYQVCTLNHSFF